MARRLARPRWLYACAVFAACAWVRVSGTAGSLNNVLNDRLAALKDHLAAASEHHQLGLAASALLVRHVRATARHRAPDRRECRCRMAVQRSGLPGAPTTNGRCASRQQKRQCTRQWDWQSLLRPRASAGTDQVHVDSFKHELPNGLHLEVLHQAASVLDAGGDCSKAPILFLHGAGHAAWCWQEHFMPFFAEHGWESFAVSMRGHGGSGPASAAASTMDEQIRDLASLVGSMQRAPILVAHSLGGIVAQRYLMDLSAGHELPPLSGCALLTNAGPRKFMPTPQWFMEQGSPLRAARVFWYMLARPLDHGGLVKDMLFSPDLPADEFARYHELIKSAPKGLPIKSDDMTHHQPVLGGAELPPVFVLGSQNDAMIMPHQIRDAADFFGTQAVMLPGVAHDVMLDTRWHTAAKVLMDWLQTLRL